MKVGEVGDGLGDDSGAVGVAVELGVGGSDDGTSKKMICGVGDGGTSGGRLDAAMRVTITSPARTTRPRTTMRSLMTDRWCRSSTGKASTPPGRWR